jgi:formylglycine-generating enzyme required for sulfatase activity
MKPRSWLMAAMLAIAAMMFLAADAAMADTFGSGGNQFTLDFVPISGTTNPTSGYGIVNPDYRIGKFEITNDQWNKFVAAFGAVTGSPSSAYDADFYSWGTGTSTVPTNCVCWYEAAQFVNWLNTNTGNQPAYKFTGTPHTGDYTFVPWTSGDTGYNASNPYRNTAAKYFMPSEDEWVKAAYWNGTALQTYATKDNGFPAKGNGTSGTGWNYYNNGYATNPYGPWAVGSGSQELNGTYDMMGNNFEWMESPGISGNYDAGSLRGLRGGYWSNEYDSLVSYYSSHSDPTNEHFSIGFRVASVPEPGSLAMLLGFAATALLCYWRKHV